MEGGDAFTNNCTSGYHQAQGKEQDPKMRSPWSAFVVLNIIFWTQDRCVCFAIPISLMLSSQTKGEVTDAAVAKLCMALCGSLSTDVLIAADDSTVSETIDKLGFWKRKTQYVVRGMSCALVIEQTISRYLKPTAQRLRDFDPDVPKTVDELCSLPDDIGPKMVFLALQVA